MRDELFEEQGFQRCETDIAVYTKRVGPSWIFVPSHVDDLLGAMNAIKLWDDMIEGLARRVSFSKVENLGHHLGALYSFDIPSGTIFVSMAPFITDLLIAQGMQDAKPAPTPMVAGTYVLKAGTPLTSISLVDYQSLLGSLGWIVEWRPDIAYPVRGLQRHGHDPTEEQLKVAKHLMRYLAGTKHLAIRFVSDGEGLKANSDSSWASCPETRKSILGDRKSVV